MTIPNTEVTFAQLADTWLRVYSAKKHSPDWRAKMARYLSNDILPHLGERPFEDIKRKEIARLFARYVEAGVVGKANHVLSAIQGIFSWAMRSGRLEGANPAQGIKREPLPSRERFLSYEELRLVWQACEGLQEYTKIVRLMILTGNRRIEIGGLRWTEVNLEKRQIELPGSRTKNRRPHIIPLSDLAMSLLPDPREGYPHVFGRVRDKKGFDGYSKCKKMLNAKIGGMAHWRLHDLRRTFITHVVERGIAQPHIAEACVNHVSGHKGGVAGVYNRATYADAKRETMEAWSAEVESIVGGRTLAARGMDTQALLAADVRIGCLTAHRANSQTP
jgi:integrase